MAKFRVNAEVTITILKTIEAESKEAAIEAAHDLSMPSLCYQCSGGGEGDDDTWELTGELDGSACEITVEEVGDD